MFEVTDMREIDSNSFVKILRTARKRLSSKKSQKIAEVIAALKDNPLNAAVQYES
jgi:hypothetical protein